MSTQRIGNTGIGIGSKVFKTTVKGYLVQTFADDNTRNVLDLTSDTTLTKTAFDALLFNPDPSKRIFPLPTFNSFEAPKAESVKDTADDGTNYQVRDGIRSFIGMMKSQDTVLLKALESGECGGVADWSIYLVDKCGTIMVQEIDLGFGRPLSISKDTFDQIYTFATNTAVNDITVTFDFDKFTQDSKFSQVEVDSDAGILTARGIVSVNAVISDISLTGYTMALSFDTGYLGQRAVFTGAADTDFALNEISPTPGVITIITAVETPASSGIYVVVTAAQTTADVLETTSSPAGIVNGFELRPVRHTVAP